MASLELARPSKSNAVDLDMWDELPLALEYLDHRDDVRVVHSLAILLCLALHSFMHHQNTYRLFLRGASNCPCRFCLKDKGRTSVLE